MVVKSATTSASVEIEKIRQKKCGGKKRWFQIFFRMTEEEAVTTAGRLEYETERQKELREILSNFPQGRFLLKGAHRIDGCAQVTER